MNVICMLRGRPYHENGCVGCLCVCVCVFMPGHMCALKCVQRILITCKLHYFFPPQTDHQRVLRPTTLSLSSLTMCVFVSSACDTIPSPSVGQHSDQHVPCPSLCLIFYRPDKLFSNSLTENKRLPPQSHNPPLLRPLPCQFVLLSHMASHSPATILGVKTGTKWQL